MRAEQAKELSSAGPQTWIWAAGSKHTMRTDARLRETIQSAEDADELREAAADYLLRLTQASLDPAGELAAHRSALLALRPQDEAFGALLDDLSAGLTGLWRSVGRTREIFAPIMEAAAKADWPALRKLVAGQLQALCLAAPTLDAVDSFRGALLNHGPRDLPDYEEAVRGAFDDVLVKKPRQAARDLRASLDRLPPEKVAEELARITDPAMADPLTAARIVQEACDTIIDLLDPLRLAAPHDGRAFPLFDSIAAAIDSASRSPESDIVIGMIARAAPEQRLSEMIWRSLAECGVAPTLALEKIRHIELNDDTDLAELELRESVLPAVDSYYQLVREAVEDFYDLAATLLSPLWSWAGALPEEGAKPPLAGLDAAWRGYCAAFPDEAAQLDAGLRRLEQHGYRLVRISEALRSYAPHFEASGLCEELEGRADAFIDEENPELAFALALSDAAFIEGVRAANLDGMLQTPFLDALHFRLADPGWGEMLGPSVASISGGHWYGIGPSPALRELWRGARKRISAAQPGWPASAAGRRLVALLGLHASRALTDSRKASAAPGKVCTSLALLTGRAENAEPRAKLFALRARLESAAADAAGQATPSGWAAQVAETLLDGLDHHDRILKSMQNEPFNRQFLIEAGVGAELAHLLASNDPDGIGCAMRLQAWCAHSGASFADMLQWLVRQDADWVRDFVLNALLSIDADRDGAFPLTLESGDIESADPAFPDEDALPPDAEETSCRATLIARTIAGIGEWARATGRPLPGG